jgi:hypothetical protein
MVTDDPWTLLRSGKETSVKLGLRQIETAYSQDICPSSIMELGVAYLWLHRFEDAWQHFYRAIQADSDGMSSFHGMAGASKWCAGEYDKAVECWVAGLDAGYADTAGLGIQMPLLLHTASVLKPNTYDQSSAISILREKTQDSRIGNWPGPIVNWLVNQITEKMVLTLCEASDEPERNDNRWLTDFYRAVILLSKGGKAASKSMMVRLVDTSLPEWSDEDFFLSRMWNEEFFLARCCVKESP